MWFLFFYTHQRIYSCKLRSRCDNNTYIHKVESHISTILWFYFVRFSKKGYFRICEFNYFAKYRTYIIENFKTVITAVSYIHIKIILIILIQAWHHALVQTCRHTLIQACYHILFVRYHIELLIKFIHLMKLHIILL